MIGVYIQGSTATANLVAGNFIGTDITGKLAVANLQGVVIADGASNNTIGGLTTTPGTGAGNVISGNTDSGVQITVENTNVGATGNLVEGNLIGTAVTAAQLLARAYDGGDGVFIEAGSLRQHDRRHDSRSPQHHLRQRECRRGDRRRKRQRRRGRLYRHRCDRDCRVARPTASRT